MAIKVAVIGTGSMGKNHVRIYSEKGLLQCICDINPKTKKDISKKYKVKGYSDYKKMIESEDINAVSIATPTKSHKEIAEYCLKKGVHVLLEKPIASTLAEANALCKLKHKQVFTVGHIERFNPAVLRLKKMIDEGKLGKIISINAMRVGPYIPKQRDTGVLLDLAVHDVDIINCLFGRKPNYICANGGSLIGSPYEDYAEIFMKYGKVNGHIQVNWINPIKIRELSVTGKGGYARLNYYTQKLKLYKPLVIKEGATISDFKNIRIKYEEPLKLEIEHFIKCINKKEKPLVTPEQATEAVKITLGAFKKL